MSTVPAEEPLTFEVNGWPTFPAGVLPHDSVNVDAEDPALNEAGKRQCVTSRGDGERCGAAPVNGLLLCSLHAGRLDSAQGGKARSEKMRERRERAEQELGRRSLGTRAMIADVLHQRAEDVAIVVNGLIDRAKAGDMKAQSLLLPYIDQALGKPTERVEHDLPSTIGEVREADSAALAQLVAEGRKRRLAAVPDERTG